MSSIKHVAIIMDGNGRWAKERKRPRVWGHVRGSNRVTDIVTAASKMGLESLTLYAFSTENWSRPTDEVKNIFKLLKKFLKREKNNILKNNISFNVIGNYKVLDSSIVALIEDLKEASAHNDGLRLSVAINYGGRSEIVDAVNSFLQKNNTREITEDDITAHLYDTKVKNIDLLIRTSGDQRISNFLLWEVCYSEFYFTDTKWPDFSVSEFQSIIERVSARERRFGGLTTDQNFDSAKVMAKNGQKTLS